MALANTIWPSNPPAPEALIDWLSSFYAISDSESENSGEKLASLFTSNGVLYGLQGIAAGTEEIAASRKSAWTVVSAREHSILQVYAGSFDFSDILIIVKLIAELHNGNKVETEFIAQVKFEGIKENTPKGTLYKVWADSTPWVKAMQKSEG